MRVMSDTDDPTLAPTPAVDLDVAEEQRRLDEMEKTDAKIASDAENDLEPGGQGRTFADSGVRAEVAEDGDSDRPPADR